MTPNDRFLEAYKGLETELKANGLVPLDFENKMSEGTDKERLKVCRIMRNYISHNDVNFLCATLDQIKFIEVEAIVAFNECKKKYTEKKMRELYDSLYEVILFMYDDNLKEMESPTED